MSLNVGFLYIIGGFLEIIGFYLAYQERVGPVRRDKIKFYNWFKNRNIESCTNPSTITENHHMYLSLKKLLCDYLGLERLSREELMIRKGNAMDPNLSTNYVLYYTDKGWIGPPQNELLEYFEKTEETKLFSLGLLIFVIGVMLNLVGNVYEYLILASGFNQFLFQMILGTLGALLLCLGILSVFFVSSSVRNNTLAPLMHK